MKPKIFFFFFYVIVCSLFLETCRKDDPVIDIPGSAYPNEIGKIMLTRCAVSGCHNTQSKDAAAGLDLSSWNTMFQGDRSGNSVTIPYASPFSTLFLFTNTYPDLGLSIPPIMPINGDHLSHEDMVKLKSWIDIGAPDRNGFVKFSDNLNRKKFYVLNQGCDIVTVFDEITLLPMRYISIGKGTPYDSPHMIRVSPDGNYWYVCFLAYPYLQRYRTSDDSYAGQVYIGNDSYNTFILTSDSKKAFCVGYNNGKIARVNLQTMTLIDTLQGFAASLHGSALIPGDSILYVSATFGNYLIKLDPNNLFTNRNSMLDGTSTVITSSSLDPHDIIFSPDGSKYFVTCQTSNEVRVMQPKAKNLNDVLVTTIALPSGSKPQELAVSATRNFLFVTCQEDLISFPGVRGSVYAIDLNTYAVTPVNVGYQPHGLAVDDNKGLVYVANRNFNVNGPAPHHTTNCGGKNGYVTIIDMNTMKIISNKKIELVSDPYSVALKK